MGLNEGFDINRFGDPVPNAFIENSNGYRIFTVNNAILNPPLPFNLGGHGRSNGCFRFDFLSGWDDGGEASLVFDKIDLSDPKNTSLQFTYAYAARGGFAFDQFIIEFSTDCGETWIEVFNKTGQELITRNDPGLQSRYYPPIDEWISDSLDISEFDGEEEVIIRIHGVSGGSQAFWMDDIIVKSNPTTDVEDELNANALSIYPNPATDMVNFELNLEIASEVELLIRDLEGRIIDRINAGHLSEGRHNLTWEATSAGMYMVEIATDHGHLTKKSDCH